MQPDWPLQQTGCPRRSRSRHATGRGRLLSAFLASWEAAA
jgi:hypothetical protein